MIVKKYLYNYQTIIHFSSPVTGHFFSLRCMPCVNACQQVVKRDMFLHPSDYLIYGADAWGNPLQYGSRSEAHDSFILSAAVRRSSLLTAFRNLRRGMYSGWNLRLPDCLIP